MGRAQSGIFALCPIGALDRHVHETIGPVAVRARLVRRVRVTFWALSGRVIITVTVHLALELLVTSGRETV